MIDRGFDPIAMFRLLNKHGVEYVVIGGFAGKLYGSTITTVDLDVTYARDGQNLKRLAAALSEVHARLRGVPEGMPFRLDAKTLAMGDSFTFVTDLGDFDILATPSGTEGYTAISLGAIVMDLDEVAVRVASLDALLAMKRAAGRPKDLAAVEILEAIKDEIENGSSS